MDEIFEFRLLEQHAENIFGNAIGANISSLARKLTVNRNSEIFCKIGEFDQAIKASGSGFLIASWSIVRKYTKAELTRAELFLFSPLAYFEPAGEECGTIYDDGPACDICLAGARQVTPLFLPISRIPKKPDIAKTIAGEIVINQRLVDLFKEHGVTGATFGAVRQKGGKDLKSLGWYQLAPQPPYAEIIAPTMTGITPFDEDPENKYRCPNGDTIGLNYLSEITISAQSRGDSDIIATRQFIGRRAGYLRPERSILISQKVRRILEENKIKGFRLEVAHIAHPPASVFPLSTR